MYGKFVRAVSAVIFLLAAAAPGVMAIADGSDAPQSAPLDYVLFDTYPLAGPYFYSSTESSGPSWVENFSGKLPVRESPAYTPGSSIELRYRSCQGGSWKATVQRHAIRGQDPWDNGVFVQEVPSPFKKPEVLHFRFRSVSTDVNHLPRVALLLGEKKVTAPVSINRFLSKPERGWVAARIPISEFFKDGIEPIKQAEKVKGVVFSQAMSDGEEGRVFLDQIDLRPAAEPPLNRQLVPSITSATGFERHVDVAWKSVDDGSVAGTIIERSQDGSEFVPIGYRPKWMHRFADYVGDKPGNFTYRVCFLAYTGQISPYSEPRSATTRKMSDDELLQMVQEACCRYYIEGAEPASGMTVESIPGDPHMIAIGASGFGIYSLVVAAQHGFIERDSFIFNLDRILNFLEHADRYHGAYGHYYDGRTGHHILFFGPDDDGGDLVETSFLMQGLLTARQFLNPSVAEEESIQRRITKLWEEVEWDWYRQTADGKYLLWHWSPDKGWKINHHLIGWNETMITYLMAIASPTHGVPPQLYYSGWASQEKFAQQYRGNAAGKMYTNGETYFGKKLDVGGFTGGPLFFTHYNFLGMNPHELRDKYTDYFENCQTIAEINLRYCQENPKHHQGYGETGWGLTASDGPFEYSADEPRQESDKGKITPTGAIASMPYLPMESFTALTSYYRDCGKFLWGEYGFRDAFDPEANWVNDLYMGLNQAPMVTMIENYRTGLPWKLFGSNPEIKKMRAAVFPP